MNRRTLLGACGALAATAGCLTPLQSSSGSGSSPVVHKDFYRTDPWDDSSDGPPTATKTPTITFDERETSATVVGNIYVGSSNCDRAVLEDVSFGDESERLRIHVGHAEVDDQPQYCTTDLSMEGYRVVVELDEQLPALVEATETGWEETRTAVEENPYAETAEGTEPDS